MASIVLATMLAVVAKSASAQDPGCDPLRIYDMIIPTAVDDASQRGADEVVVIRYIPGDTSVDREFRITIVASANGTITATRIDPAQSSIHAQLRNAEERKPAAACEELLKDFRLERRHLHDQPVLRRLLRGLNRIKMPVRLPSEIYLDAPRYEIVEWAKMNQVSFSIYDGSDRTVRPLIDWVKSVAAAFPTRTPADDVFAPR
ncbi:MAG: hypothetical protein ABI779_08590 [Acidobacteriota bacterium]